MVQYITTVKEIINETHDVKTFRLTRPANFEFNPGQFSLFKLNTNKSYNREDHPFTMSSSPLEKNHVDFTIKEMTDFTNDLFKLKTGDEIIIEEPQRTTLEFLEKDKQDIVFIAGGSGITPFISSLRFAIQKNMKNNFLLLYANRTLEDIIYKKELNNIQKNNGNIKIIHVLSSETKPHNYESGYIDKEKIEKHVKNKKNTTFYLCGPPPMMNSMLKILSELKVSKKNTHYETWLIPGKSDIQKTTIK